MELYLQFPYVPSWLVMDTFTCTSYSVEEVWRIFYFCIARIEQKAKWWRRIIFKWIQLHHSDCFLTFKSIQENTDIIPVLSNEWTRDLVNELGSCYVPSSASNNSVLCLKVIRSGVLHSCFLVKKWYSLPVLYLTWIVG